VISLGSLGEAFENSDFQKSQISGVEQKKPVLRVAFLGTTVSGYSFASAKLKAAHLGVGKQYLEWSVTVWHAPLLTALLCFAGPCGILIDSFGRRADGRRWFSWLGRRVNMGYGFPRT
jgi:hypothetical protein